MAVGYFKRSFLGKNQVNPIIPNTQTFYLAPMEANYRVVRTAGGFVFNNEAVCSYQNITKHNSEYSIIAIYEALVRLNITLSTK